MNKQHLYTSLFLALSSAYLLSGCAAQSPGSKKALLTKPLAVSPEQEKQLSAERAGHLRQTHVRFNALDKDEDGYISLAEFSRSGDAAFTRADTNKDLALSVADPKPAARGEDTRSASTRAADEAKAQQQPARPARLLKMPSTHSVSGLLAMYDSNGDGQVSQQEYSAGRQQQFDTVDVNQDGQLSYDEYVQEFATRLDVQIARTKHAIKAQ